MKFINNVNNLNGKDWLKNAVNFWTFDKYDIDDIYNRFLMFCYKDRTSNPPLKNISEIKNVKSDFSFNYIKEEDDIVNAINVILNGAYNSYHIAFLENELINNILIAPSFTKNLDIKGIEYRGKFIIQIKNDNKIFTALMFLNRATTPFNDRINCKLMKINNNELCPSYIIESRSKMDRIGLSHPAPYSYIDINKLAQIEHIQNKTILDPFLGVGSTIIGTYENNYNIGIELNQKYVNLITQRFELLSLPESIKDHCSIICGDSLEKINEIDKPINIVITSPPYFNILKNKTSGVRTDNSQTRQGVEYYSNSQKDMGNIDEYSLYLATMKDLFSKIRRKMTRDGKFYLIISDFTVNKKEKDVHSDFIEILINSGFKYTGTSYIKQNQKAIYPFGYPFKLVINHIYQYILKFEVESNE